jgi:dTDP-4-dehydrorhamnose 3,5-epimerase-like enzyme
MGEDHNSIPRLIEGGLAVDDRGQVSFVNDFGFSDVRRFYMVSNHGQGFVRAWHAHRREAKYVFVTSGAAIVGAVEIDDWDKPSKTAHVHRYVLSARKPSILYIPAGYANGFKSLTEDANIVFFSTASMEEAKTDDVRYDARYWDIWEIVER